jgi:hypothetical protein
MNHDPPYKPQDVRLLLLPESKGSEFTNQEGAKKRRGLKDV